MQGRFVVNYRRFGKTYRSNLQGLDMGRCVTPHKNKYLTINLLAPELLLFFLILAHPVYKMWIQEPNTLELWNKLHFEEK